MIRAAIVAAALVLPHGAAADYRGDVERTFLAHGVSMDVMTDGKKIIFWGFWSKALVFNLAPSVLPGAREAGFKTVVFHDKGPDGMWTFDVSKGVPKCDVMRRVCL